MKTMNIFLILTLSLFSFTASQVEIDVVAAEYEEQCNSLEPMVITLDYITEGTLIYFIETFTIKMVLDNATNPVEYEIDCIEDEEGYSDFTCPFEPSVPGIYHPKLDAPVETEDYIILPFDLQEYKVGFSKKHYVAPFDFSVFQTIYIEQGVDLYKFPIEFNEELTTEIMPTVKLEDKILNCVPFSSGMRHYAECEVDRKVFPELEEIYQGELINVCGLVDIPVEILFKEKEPAISVIVYKFDDSIPELNCGRLEYEKELNFSFTFEDGEISEGEVYYVSNEVKLVYSEEESIQIDTECYIESQRFYCKPIVFDEFPGKYYAYLQSDVIIEGDSSDIILKAFNSTNMININDNYVPLNTTKVNITYDYKDKTEGEFTFEFQSDVEEPANVYANNRELQCKVDSKTETCTFTKQQLPPHGKTIPYKGYIENACGNKELDILINIEDSSKTNITLNKTNLNSTTLLSTDGPFSFNLYFETIDNLTNTIEITAITLATEDENTIQNLTCKYSPNQDKFFICSIQNPKSGTYKILLKEDFEGDDYIIGKYTSTERIIFVQGYSKPVKNLIDATHDYSKSKIGAFDIEFEKELGGYMPTIQFTDFQLTNCKAKAGQAKILECPIEQKVFPSNPDQDIIFTGDLINPINVSEATINIKILKYKKDSAGGFLFINSLLLLLTLIAIA